MMYCRIYKILICALVTVIAGCKSTQEIATRASFDISDESYRYFQVKDHDNKKVLEVSFALGEWHEAMKRAYESTSNLVDRLHKKPEEREKMKDALEDIQESLKNILEREVSLTLYVPQWDYRQAHSWALAQGGYVNGLRRFYKKLFDQKMEPQKMILKIKKDDQYYDTYNDCLDVFQLATAVDPYSGYCMSQATIYCGHQADITCVRRTVLEHAFEAVRDGSFCAIAEEEEEDDLSTIIIEKNKKNKDVEPKKWISDIQYCQSLEPILKKTAKR